MRLCIIALINLVSIIKLLPSPLTTKAVSSNDKLH
jgi:hypothetical protein